jgi:F-type H+-transporting ATPase subunit b
LLTLAIVCALAAQPALASEAAAEHGAHHGPDWAYFFYHAFGLALLLGVLTYFARTPLANFLKDRARDPPPSRPRRRAPGRRARDRGLRARGSARGRERRLARAAADQAEAERSAALERARQAAERIREESKRTADQEIARALRELRDEAAALATQLAGELLRQGITPDDDKRFVGEFVERIGGRG